MTGTQPSLTEWAVLAVLGEQPRHGFAVARELTASSDLGRVLTVHRPTVYRALDRLVTGGLAERTEEEPGDAGPNRTRHRATRAGRAALKRWFDTPVVHVRDLRIEFLLKLRLLERAGRDVGPLVRAQREALADTLTGLVAGTDGDVVDEWRRHNGVAASAFLAEAEKYTER